jgi:hypothetical protein
VKLPAGKHGTGKTNTAEPDDTTTLSISRAVTDGEAALKGAGYIIWMLCMQVSALNPVKIMFF